MSNVAISFPMLGLEMNPPNSVSIFGFNIYFYGIIITFGFVLAGLYILRRHDAFGLSKDNVLDIFLCAVVGGIVGARLFYVIFDDTTKYVGAGNWLNIFKVRDGGLAVYGGIILGCALAAIYAWRKKLRIAPILDAGGIAIPIGQAIGRWGNFFNREAFGYETTVPWRMGLTPVSGETIYVHPTFLYESLWNIVGVILLHIFSKRFQKYDGQVFLLYIFWYGLGRVWIEGLRTDSLYIGSTGIRVSQAIAAACIVVSAVILIIAGIKTRRKNPV